MKEKLFLVAVGLQAGLLISLLLFLGGRSASEGVYFLAQAFSAPDIGPEMETSPSAAPTALAGGGPGARTDEDAKGEARRIAELERRLARRIPAGPYMVVSSTDNSFRLMQGTGTLREGPCSTGSYILLKGAGGQEWLFTTPRGIRRVQAKKTKPVWVKPDWAFVEEGLPVPGIGSAVRIERGVLGDYALSLGDGYLIHGTPYQRLLGSPVTHGCIRLGDADLEAVYRTLPMGSPVYIY